MSNLPGQQPGQDLPEPILPGENGDDAIGRPDGEPGIGNDLPAGPDGPDPMDAPDPTHMPAMPGIPGSL